MLQHYRALLHLVMCVLFHWFVSFTMLIGWEFLIRNLRIVLSDELRAVRNEDSYWLMYVSTLCRFRALPRRRVFLWRWMVAFTVVIS